MMKSDDGRLDDEFDDMRDDTDRFFHGGDSHSEDEDGETYEISNLKEMSDHADLQSSSGDSNSGESPVETLPGVSSMNNEGLDDTRGILDAEKSARRNTSEFHTVLTGNYSKIIVCKL